jgi:hypothetical protein
MHTTQKLGRVRTVPRLCGFYPGICLTTEEKARKNLSQGSHRYNRVKKNQFEAQIILSIFRRPLYCPVQLRLQTPPGVSTSGILTRAGGLPVQVTPKAI